MREREDEELRLQESQTHQSRSRDGGGGGELSEDADHGLSELWLLVWVGGGLESATKLNH